jgi:hypothetical protein
MRGGRKGTLAAFASVLLVALTASCVAPQPQAGTAAATPSPPTVSNLVGTWMLESAAFNLPPSDPQAHVGVGPGPQGLLIFDAGGRFSFILMGGDDKAYDTTGRGSAGSVDTSPKGNRKSVEYDRASGIVAYWGKIYKVSNVATNGFYTLTLTLTDHSYKNYVTSVQPGQVYTQTRLIQYTTDTPPKLVFENNGPSTGGSSVLVFDRQTP